MYIYILDLIISWLSYNFFHLFKIYYLNKFIKLDDEIIKKKIGFKNIELKKKDILFYGVLLIFSLLLRYKLYNKYFKIE